MEKEMNNFELPLDSIIRRFLVDEGYIFPFTDNEIESALKECSESNYLFPQELDDPLKYINNVQVKITKRPFLGEVDDEKEIYLKDFSALAARGGEAGTPEYILEQMKKDREKGE